MAAHHDEEALGGLLEVERPAVQAHPVLRASRSYKALIGVGAVAGLAAVSWWGSDATVGATHQSVPETVPLQELDLESKFAREPDSALHPSAAVEKETKRKQLGIEQDLTALFHKHVPSRQSNFRESMAEEGAGACAQHAESLFDDIMVSTSLHDELTAEERHAFRSRFAAAMTEKCKGAHDENVWRQIAGVELQQQKPLMTEAVVVAVNKAGLGFKAKFHPWQVDETAVSVQGRLGYLPVPDSQGDVLNRKAGARQANVDLPVAFRAEAKWPECRDEILRIHNQGHCGSCWAFGALASVDARMCIASGGKWNAQEDLLSRLQVVSCAPDMFQSHDGCQGGWPHWAMVMMAQTGISSQSCLPYYISGAGSEHFQQQREAPPCETHCQNGYSSSMRNDTFTSAGIANYDWLRAVHGDAEKMRMTKVAMLQEGPVPFAFYANSPFMSYQSGVFSVCTGHDRANHAVYAFGWGLVAGADGGEAVEYVEASNSWGPNWGHNGHFRIHPRCITDVTIPGTIESSVVSHHIGSVDHSVAPDANNPIWPWSPPNECPYVDGCVTDMEGPEVYSDNEKCLSDKLNGKIVRVVEFETESGFDILKINGHRYSGIQAHGLDGQRVDSSGIEFTSDASVAKAGFKICEA